MKDMNLPLVEARLKAGGLCPNTENPLYIFGDGELAKRVRIMANRKDIKGVILDDIYYDKKNNPGYVKSSDIPRLGKIDVIAGMLDYQHVCRICRSCGNVENVLLLDRLYGTEYINTDFVDENKTLFMETYDQLANNRSKHVFKNYLKSNISRDISLMQNNRPLEEQYLTYAEKMIYEDTSFVVCGAYDGKTILQLIDHSVGGGITKYMVSKQIQSI